MMHCDDSAMQLDLKDLGINLFDSSCKMEVENENPSSMDIDDSDWLNILGVLETNSHQVPSANNNPFDLENPLMVIDNHQDSFSSFNFDDHDFRIPNDIALDYIDFAT